MPRSIATNTPASLDDLRRFLSTRHQMILATVRRDGRPQLSPVTGGLDPADRILISTYPSRAKVVNIRADGAVSLCVLSDEWNGPWVQIDGTAEVVDLPAAEDGLVAYFRCISGEHPDWNEYRAAMRLQGKSLIVVTPVRWGPIATGGFPAEIAARLDAAPPEPER